MNLTVTLVGSKWMKIPLEPSILKKCVIRKCEDTSKFFFLKPLKTVASASQNISPFRRCYITRTSNTTRNYNDGQQIRGSRS